MTTGWPSQVPDELKPFNRRQAEISIKCDWLLLVIWVINLKSLQEVSRTLYEGHQGIVRMKFLAWSYMGWNCIDQDIEKQAKSCKTKSCKRCQEQKSNPLLALLHACQWPAGPNKRILVNFEGPFLGKIIFIMVDAHSKWPEVSIMPSTTFEKTIEVLSSFFTRYRLPEKIVSDSGTKFTSTELERFIKEHRNKHIKSATYFWWTNGLVQRFVQTLHKQWKLVQLMDFPFHFHPLNRFLRNYKTTLYTTNNSTQSKTFLQRKVRTMLDLLQVNAEKAVQNKQLQQKRSCDQQAKLRTLKEGQPVQVRNYISAMK